MVVTKPTMPCIQLLYFHKETNRPEEMRVTLKPKSLQYLYFNNYYITSENKRFVELEQNRIQQNSILLECTYILTP